ncbi:MAG: hypothetical protein Q9216_005444 [Gyalolechia sp. 2 TL-2023]
MHFSPNKPEICYTSVLGRITRPLWIPNPSLITDPSPLIWKIFPKKFMTQFFNTYVSRTEVLYRAVLPSLYRSVAFEIDSSVGSYRANYKLLRMADKENPGLLHIEHVTLSLKDELTRVRNRTADYPDAIQLLQVIPKDTLLYFKYWRLWDSWHTVPTQLLRILLTRQRKLTNVELIESHQSLDKLAAVISGSNESKEEYTLHPCVNSLRIADVRDGSVPLIALQLLQSRPKIDILMLTFWNIMLNADYHANHRNAPSDGLLKKLMAPPAHLRPPHRLAIKELHLDFVDLRQDCHLLLTALDTTVLKVLEVIHCKGPRELLTQMSKLPARARPQLRRLEILHMHQPPRSNWVSDDDHTDRTIKSINDLLLSMNNTLSNLWIVMRGIQCQTTLLSPLVSGIENHGQSLFQLTVDIRTHLPPFVDRQCVGWFPQVGWERIAASMTKLELLCVPFPPVVANEHCTSRREHQDYLATALQIPTLKILISSTWPYPHHTTLFHPADKRPYGTVPFIDAPYHTSSAACIPHTFYVTCLSHLVDRITGLRAELIRNPRRDLEVVGFGLFERNHFMKELYHGLRPTFFVKSCTVTMGREEICMRPCGEELWDSDLGDLLMEGAQDVDWLARRERVSDAIEIHPRFERGGGSRVMRVAVGRH